MDLDRGYAVSINQTQYRFVDDTSALIVNAAFDILSLATGGRMTIARMWRALGPGSSVYRLGLNNIGYYGEIPECRKGAPDIVPGFSTLWTADTVAKIDQLERLRDVELIRQAIIWEGKFWV